ncbi:MAG TPA: hypothetical protein PKI32_07155, partial [Opitutales bacterium]|nr:hypothetical protein [Opitutales bacterium]
HHASSRFWTAYDALPAEVRITADRAFKLLKANPRHPSLRLKNVGKYYSVRVGLHHRALGVPINDGILWFWIGSHEEYDRIIS